MQNRKNELYYEQLGDGFDRLMSSYDVWRRAVLIRQLLPKDAADRNTLEIGCGTGRISEMLVKWVSQLTVTDLSGNLARQTGERLGLKWYQENACQLSQPDATWDLVVSSECIEHTPSPALALKEMCRVLRPGGALVVTSPNKLWFPAVWLAMRVGCRGFQGNEVWLFPRNAATRLKANGLEIMGMRGCHLFPWQAPLAKSLLPSFDRWGGLLWPVMINYAIAARKPNGSH